MLLDFILLQKRTIVRQVTIFRHLFLFLYFLQNQISFYVNEIQKRFWKKNVLQHIEKHYGKMWIFALYAIKKFKRLKYGVLKNEQTLQCIPKNDKI